MYLFGMLLGSVLCGLAIAIVVLVLLERDAR